MLCHTIMGHVYHDTGTTSDRDQLFKMCQLRKLNATTTLYWYIHTRVYHVYDTVSVGEQRDARPYVNAKMHICDRNDTHPDVNATTLTHM